MPVQEAAEAATVELARKEKERLRKQDQQKRQRLEELRNQQNNDAAASEVTLLGFSSTCVCLRAPHMCGWSPFCQSRLIRSGEFLLSKLRRVHQVVPIDTRK